MTKATVAIGHVGPHGKYTLLAACFLTAVVTLSFGVNCHELRSALLHQMQLRAADESEKDLTYKLWNDRQGYSAGEIRGGVSVIIPMKEALEDYDSSLTVAALSHVGIWLVGMIFLFIGQKKLTAGWQAEREAQNELQMNIDQSREFIKSALDSLDGHVAFLKIDIGMILQLKQMLFTDKLFFIKNFSY